MQEVTVQSASARYPVRVERGLLSALAARISGAGGAPTSVAVVVDSAIAGTHGAAATAGLQAAGIRIAAIPMHASEAAKSLATVQALCERMAEAGLDRNGCVVALGGGIVGDTAGYAAASYMRGVALVQVPTTLLAMVDASIGGKTGVNLQRADGALAKNMVGAFWNPLGVFADPALLGSLPEREIRCGLAECVKHAVISDPALLPWIEANCRALLGRDEAALELLIARCAGIKAAIVSRDERESGPRALLNLGHTFAHAIEALDHATIKHGEAVSIGLVAAVQLAVELGVAPAAHEWGVQRVLEQIGLPTRIPASGRADAGADARAPRDARQYLEAMRSDKKALGGKLRMVVPHALGDVRVLHEVPAAAILSAWRAVGAQ